MKRKILYLASYEPAKYVFEAVYKKSTVSKESKYNESRHSQLMQNRDPKIFLDDFKNVT